MYSLPNGGPCNGHNMMLGALIADDGSLMSHEDTDDVALADGFEPLHFMVEPMV